MGKAGQESTKLVARSGWWEAALFAVGFAALAVVGDQCSFKPHGFVSLWLPGGLFLAVLLLKPVTLWWRFLAAGVMANVAFDLLQGQPLTVCLLFSAGNVLEAVVGASLVRRFLGGVPCLDRPRHVLGFVGLGAVGGPIVGATLGATAIQVLSGEHAFWWVWLHWWTADVMGILVIGPLSLELARQLDSKALRLPASRLAEAVALVVVCAATTWSLNFEPTLRALGMYYLLIPAIIWAALRFGLLGASVSVLVVALTTSIVLAHFPVRLVGEEAVMTGTLLAFHVRIGILSLTGLLIASLFRQSQQREADLRAQAHFLGTLVDRSPIGFVALDSQRQVTLWNSAAESIFNWRADEMVGSPVGPDDLRDLKSRQESFHRDFFEPDQLEGTDRTVLRKDGSPAEVRVWTVPLPGTGVSGSGVLALVHDVTRERQAEASARELERRFRELLEGVQLLTVILDPDGRILFANECFQKTVGWRADELLGRDWFATLIAEPNRGRIREQFLGSSPSPEGDRGVVEIITRAGDLRTIAWSRTRLRGAEGEPAGVAALGEDITERLRLEEQLRQAQKMEAIGRLAGGVAHHFNNILAAILIHLGLLRGRESLEPETKASLAELEVEAKRGTDLVRQLLAFGRRTVMQARPVDLAATLGTLQRLLQRLLGEDISLEVRSSVGLPPIQADPGMLEQVIMNLCVHARNSMPKGGVITMTSDVVDVRTIPATGPSEARPGPYVRLAVGDTGGGLDPATVERVFEPFIGTASNGRGTGLGLATVHGIAAQHRGWAEVDNQPGRGTTFRVYWPVAPAPSPLEAKPPELRSLPRGDETILLVEDEDHLRRVIGQCLRLFGYRVLEAAHGAEALEVWKDHADRIQLLLSDMVMPGGLSGSELAHRLRRERPALQVILTSGYSTELVTRGAPAEPGFSYLAKPVEMAVLVFAVRASLDAGRPPAPGVTDP